MQISHQSPAGQMKSDSFLADFPDGVPLREQLSALTDGESKWVDWHALDAGYDESAELRRAWSDYHLIRDALSGQAYPGCIGAADFVSQVMARVAQEPQRPVAFAATEAPVVTSVAANDPVFRWKMAAGFASLAAVAALTWHLVASPVPAVGPQLAAAPPAPDNTQLVVTPSGGVMIRDAQLDELMAAHRQWGGMSALQMPAGFLRSATYEPSHR